MNDSTKIPPIPFKSMGVPYENFPHTHSKHNFQNSL